MSEMCNICGQLPGTIITGNNIVCQRCINLFGTCEMCKEMKNVCRFFSDDTIELPKFITKTAQRGSTVMMQTQVMNPARIELTCKTGCKCYDEEIGCYRQACGTCGKYEEVEL